jgi:hypothetical protein
MVAYQPCVRAGHQPELVEQRALRQQRRALAPARPAGSLLKCHQLAGLSLVAGVRVVPLLHRPHDLLDAGDRAVGLREVDERGVEHVPGAVPVDLRHAVAVDAQPRTLRPA